MVQISVNPAMINANMSAAAANNNQAAAAANNLSTATNAKIQDLYDLREELGKWVTGRQPKRLSEAEIGE